jgi:ABC-2 type transport system permease protein
MIAAIFRIMFLGVLRDRSAFAMAFVLPPLIYVIFATIFSVTAGGDLRVKVAIVDQANSEASRRLSDALRKSPDIRIAVDQPADAGQLEAMVRRGAIDAGIVIRADPAGLDKQNGSPIRIIGDAGRAIAVPIVTGHLLRLFGASLPDAVYRRTIGDIESHIVQLTPPQHARVDAVLEEMRKQATGGASERRQTSQDQLVEQVMLESRTTASAAVIYYAGAVGFMFLLFSAAQGAMSLIDERQNGIVARMLGGTGSVEVLLTGKFLFLLAQGVIQIGLIFAIAELKYSVEVHKRLLEWFVITFMASACAASMSLVLASLCTSRQQAITLSNFIVLVMSAIGGSMVPRFLMPDWLQEASWLFPTAWAVEGYNGLLWRNAGFDELLMPVALLAGVSIASLAIAVLALRHSVDG